jgi:glycosyltransferase involved in cell wall biosynthesis
MQTRVSRERATIVVPCYNEARRLDLEAFSTFVAGDSKLDLLFVDDGSEDETAELLESLRARLPARIGVLPLEENRGKAEAVRRGLLRALASGADIVGYLDADLATPVDEMARLLDVLRAGDTRVLLGSRVALLGRDIQRTAVRHYLGRVFASAASLVLRTTVYDSQCGAKLFRRTPALEAALRQPFLSRWLFDVELLGRILVPENGIPALAPGEIREEPLGVWTDIEGSKIRPWHFVMAAVDMSRIAADLGRRRRRTTGPHPQCKALW